MAAELLGMRLGVTFTPHLAPVQRGLSATVSFVTTADSREVIDVLNDSYAASPMVNVVDEPPISRWVAGSHGAMVWGTKDEHSGRAIVVSAIDNLGKGAAGQAVQCLNIAQGWPEDTGLHRSGWLA